MTYIILSTATLLLFLFLSPLTTTSTTTTTAVLDIDGSPLTTDSDYYILPAVRGQGGALTMAPMEPPLSCPPYVVQETLEVSNGLPLKFYPINPTQKNITLSTDLNIVFKAPTICVGSTGWSMELPHEDYDYDNDNDEAGAERWYVSTGGTVGDPNVETQNYWFKIEKAGSGKYNYKIVFCPDFCTSSNTICGVPYCGDVGVFEKDGTRFLVSSDHQPLLVKFKKVVQP